MYKWSTDKLGTSYGSTGGLWKTYSYTLPDDENTYYFYFVGAKGEWKGKCLSVDNVSVISKDGDCLDFESFDNGMTDCIFNMSKLSVSNSLPKTDDNYYIYFGANKGNWSKDGESELKRQTAHLI